MATKYAARTKVSPQKSREEIERNLKRYGASGFLYATQDLSAVIQFQFKGRLIKFAVTLPPPGEYNYLSQWEQEERRLWRSLCNGVKAKLDFVESGITTFDEEFLAYTVGPDGRTIAQFLIPQLDRALQEGRLPALLPGRVDD